MLCLKSLTLDGDNSGIIMDKIAARFTDSGPEVEGRSTEAIKERWKKLLESYRYAIWMTVIDETT